MSSSWKVVVCWTLMVFAVMVTKMSAAGAFAESSDPGTFEDLKAGAGRISAVFAYKSQRIRIETIRGPRIPNQLRQYDPGAPRFEIDIRLVDESGYPFFVQFGGHGPIDESWTKSDSGLPEELAVPSDEQARRNFIVAERALEALTRSRFKVAWLNEQRALANIVPAIREAIAMDTLEPLSPGAAEKSTCNYRHVLSVYKGSAFLGIAGSEHSATRATNVSPTGQVTQIWASSNHGRTYSEAGMSFYDSWIGFNRCSLGSISWPQCVTSYGITKGTHVCNDDSVTQCLSLQTMSTPNGTSGTCSDSTLRLKAPRCD